MKDLLKQSLTAHTNYVTKRIWCDEKKLDFYNEMWYYIDNTEQFKLLSPTDNTTEGGKLARTIYLSVFTSIKERFL